MDTLLLKLLLTPVLIGAVSLASRRWGPAVGGWLVGLPLTSGPIALLFALEQGEAFAAEAAKSVLVGLASSATFCLAYSRLAPRMAWLPAALGSWGAYLGAVALLGRVSLPLAGTFAGVVVVLGLVLWLLPAVRGAVSAVASPRWEIPARMVAATAFVVLLTGLAGALGPRLSGLLTPFPVFGSVLAIFTHRFQGASATARLLRGIVLGSFTFAFFFLVVAATVARAGVAAAFVGATVGALLLHGGVLWVLRGRLAGG